MRKSRLPRWTKLLRAAVCRACRAPLKEGTTAYVFPATQVIYCRTCALQKGAETIAQGQVA